MGGEAGARGIDYSDPGQFRAAVLTQLREVRADLRDVRAAVMGSEAAPGLSQRVTALEQQGRDRSGAWRTVRDWTQVMIAAAVGAFAGWRAGH